MKLRAIDPTVSPLHLRCDAPGCSEEMIERHQGTQLCWVHAFAKANEARQARGKPPLVIDEQGQFHVQH